MKNTRLRNIFISIFVVLFVVAFHYESLRYFYLNPLAGRDLPKIKFLFPPAGWIMFYNVDERFSFAQVYGIKAKTIMVIDPHQILPTRFIGFDDVHRNVLSEVLEEGASEPFCRYLERKFPEFDDFVVSLIYYPSVIKTPHFYLERPIYRCRP